MTVSNSIPATVQMRRSSLFGLVAAVAVVAAGITALLLVFAVNTSSSGQGSASPSGSSPRQSDQAYVRGITSMTHVEQAAAFGGPGARLGALGLSAQDEQYVKGITRLTPVQMAAAFGGPGAMLDALGLSKQDRQYVQGITALTRTQQAAAFGR
ncbi:MAG: hypothetical protein C5B48_12815 [Candidatus Rokuibacteriota bacterium]|nr:MAG: hypothetical protein C5B48_12815 [Candidatus Rokubacteria bacterium]